MDTKERAIMPKILVIKFYNGAVFECPIEPPCGTSNAIIEWAYLTLAWSDTKDIKQIKEPRTVDYDEEWVFGNCNLSIKD